jgi:hypothetical protein
MLVTRLEKRAGLPVFFGPHGHGRLLIPRRLPAKGLEP